MAKLKYSGGGMLSTKGLQPSSSPAPTYSDAGLAYKGGSNKHVRTKWPTQHLVGKVSGGQGSGGSTFTSRTRRRNWD